jgi:hypothetical protein
MNDWHLAHRRAQHAAAFLEFERWTEGGSRRAWGVYVVELCGTVATISTRRGRLLVQVRGRTPVDAAQRAYGTITSGRLRCIKPPRAPRPMPRRVSAKAQRTAARLAAALAPEAWKAFGELGRIRRWDRGWITLRAEHRKWTATLVGSSGSNVRRCVDADPDRAVTRVLGLNGPDGQER